MLNRRGFILAGLTVMLPSGSHAASLVAAFEGETLVLAPGPARAVLRLSETGNVAALAARARTRRYVLRLAGLFANQDPETGFLVFLNLGEDATASPDDAGYVGSLSFFGVPKDLRTGSRAVSFNVSAVLLRLQQVGRLNGTISVTFLPAGDPAEGSRPSIAEIALYES